MVRVQGYYSLRQKVWFINLKPKMFVKILVRINKGFMLVSIHLSQDIIVIQVN